MTRRLNTKSGKYFDISDAFLYSGGEGAIYTTIGTNPIYAVKLYHSSKDTSKIEQKIGFMISNSPLTNAPKQYRDAIVWPIEQLYDNVRFVGYLMPFISEGLKLFSITKPILQGSLLTDPSWCKFDFANSNSYLIRLKLCYNLANVFDLLHQTKKYVIVDAKSENVIISENGHFTIIDLDSVQIAGLGIQHFKASAHTPENSPPEYHNGQINIDRDVIPVCWDYFSYAVMAYEILFGIHPFQASHKDPRNTTISSNIKSGAFVHGRNRGDLYVVPQPHNAFHQLPDSLKSLFVKCLDTGHLYPKSRPNLSDWSKTILTEIQKPHSIQYTRVHSNRPTTSLGKKRKSLRALILTGIITVSFLALIGFYSANNANDKNERVINTSYEYDFLGVYYGTIKMADGNTQRIYLNISGKGIFENSYTAVLKYAISKESITDILYFEPSTGTFSLNTLGSGVTRYNSTGTISLNSSSENPLSWELEKL